MRRTTFDRILTASGSVVVVVLIVAGSLLAWGASFISNQVHSQLAQQQIYFPPAAAFAHPKAGTEITPSMVPSVSKYAGQQLTDGAQAEAYANDFISVHLQQIGHGKTYAQVSSASQADPGNTALANEVQLLFRGTTLRGLLLTSYAFWQMGQIAGDAALAAFILAGVMLIFVALGFWHLRRVRPSDEI